MQFALQHVESARSSSFISSHENWISPDLVADFPKTPFPCCIQNAALKGLLIAYVNLTVKGDMTLISPPPPSFKWLYVIASGQVNSASQVFSVCIS